MYEGFYEEFYNGCFEGRNGDCFKEFGDDLDDEVDPEDEEFFRFLRKLVSIHGKEEKRFSIVDPARVKQVIDAYNELKNADFGPPVKVTMSLFKPVESMGYVSVIGGDIILDDPKKFAKIIEHATNVSIYSLVDGRARLDISFHGLIDDLD